MKAAAYARYSTDHQTSSSIEYQMRSIEEYCKANGITVTARFANEACTGTNTDLPTFQAVVVYDISRGIRDVADWFGFRREMTLLGIEFISVEDKLGDILNPSDY